MFEVLFFAFGCVCGWAACYWAGRKNRALFDRMNDAGNRAADAVKDAASK